MGDVELPKDELFHVARNLMDDFVRSHVAEFGPYLLDEDGDVEKPIDNPVLGDWQLLTHWMSEDGEHHYTRICSAHLAPHSRMGLNAMFDNE